MQPAPALPPVPPTPAAPVVAQLADGTPLTGLPTNPQELRGLRIRRDVLRDQLARANTRREETAQSMNRVGDAQARQGVLERLKQIDARIAQIENDQAHTEQLIANAPPGLLASTSDDGNGGPVVAEGDAVGMGFGAFLFGVILTLVTMRLRRRFRSRRDRAMGTRPTLPLGAPSDDPRMAQLSQAVGAMAEEIERIGEGQRFLTQILAGQREPSALGAQAERR